MHRSKYGKLEPIFSTKYKGGEMIFKVETETVTIQTKYSNLDLPRMGMDLLECNGHII